MSTDIKDQNDVIARDAAAAIVTLKSEGGKVIKIHNLASLPIVISIAHEVGRIFGVIAVFDSKLGKYVVAISLNPGYLVGSIID